MPHITHGYKPNVRVRAFRASAVSRLRPSLLCVNVHVTTELEIRRQRIEYVDRVCRFLLLELIENCACESIIQSLVRKNAYLPASCFARTTRGTTTTRMTNKTTPPRIIVILRFFHLISFLRSVARFLKTDACSFN